MNILFIHQNFPGQYRHLAPALAAQGHTVIGVGEKNNLKNYPHIPGVQRIGYPTPQPAGEATHRYLRGFEGQVRRGQQVARSVLALKEKGFTPDLMLGHPGWGEILYLKDIHPQVPLVGLFEFYYHGQGQDSGFDPEFALDPNFALDGLCRIRTKNVNNLLALEAVDVGVCPTAYQKSVMPPEYQGKLRILHDGINTQVAKPDPEATFTLTTTDPPQELSRQQEIITFINRNLEPYRGYHIFMRSLPRLLRERPQAQVLIVGGDGVSYGPAAPEGQTWKQIFLGEVQPQLDLNRVHFLGRIPYPQLIRLLQVSSLHVYLSYPFVLSWSMLEAMACGCLVVGSRTPPVEEVIRPGENGLLVDFFDPDQLVDTIHTGLNHPTRMQPLRTAARQTIVNTYDLDTICLPQQLHFINELLQGSPGINELLQGSPGNSARLKDGG